MRYELDEALPILTKELGEGKLTIFAGSGVSVPSGLPDWDGLLVDFIAMAESLPVPDDLHKAELLQKIWCQKIWCQIFISD